MIYTTLHEIFSLHYPLKALYMKIIKYEKEQIREQ